MTKNNQPTSTSVSPEATKETIYILDGKAPEVPPLGIHIVIESIVATALATALAAAVVFAVPAAAPALVGEAVAVGLMVPALAGPANVVIAGVLATVISVAVVRGEEAIKVAAIAASFPLVLEEGSEEKSPRTAALIASLGGKALTVIATIAAEGLEGGIAKAAQVIVASSMVENIIVLAGEGGAFGETELPYYTWL